MCVVQALAQSKAASKADSNMPGGETGDVECFAKLVLCKIVNALLVLT